MANVNITINNIEEDIIIKLNGTITSDEELTYNEAEYAVDLALQNSGYDVDNINLNIITPSNYTFKATAKNKNYNDIMDFINKRR